MRAPSMISLSETTGRGRQGAPADGGGENCSLIVLPVGHSVHLKKTCEDLELVFRKLKYDDHAVCFFPYTVLVEFGVRGFEYKSPDTVSFDILQMKDRAFDLQFRHRIQTPVDNRIPIAASPFRLVNNGIHSSPGRRIHCGGDRAAKNDGKKSRLICEPIGKADSSLQLLRTGTNCVFNEGDASVLLPLWKLNAWRNKGSIAHVLSDATTMLRGYGEAPTGGYEPRDKSKDIAFIAVHGSEGRRGAADARAPASRLTKRGDPFYLARPQFAAPSNFPGRRCTPALSGFRI
ncbi:hypothetical protein EVAR_11603_1 [Eumeta japonica]|uniref:Uncharacterized protein n=1 Tax=Eumeta variegata TaxID=151549 RepID=A0A4C1X5A1_EUMVA|nr:hypothetical protein EVAR_11603_1 [Eumeta japonica]